MLERMQNFPFRVKGQLKDSGKYTSPRSLVAGTAPLATWASAVMWLEEAQLPASAAPPVDPEALRKDARVGGFAQTEALSLPGGRRPPPRDARFRWAGRSLSAYAGSGLGAAGGTECLSPPGRHRGGGCGAGGRWWRSSGSGWRTRSTARTSLSGATSPRPRETPPRRRHPWGPGSWRYSSLWCVAQLFSKLFRVSGWACEGADLKQVVFIFL